MHFFIWSNKRKKPLVRTCIIDVSSNGDQEIPPPKQSVQQQPQVESK